MGLLDDAIREHLDLKRRRGADPGEVERAEREALGPVRREPFEPEAEEFDPMPAGAAYDQEEELYDHEQYAGAPLSDERDWGDPFEQEGEISDPGAQDGPPALDDATRVMGRTPFEDEFQTGEARPSAQPDSAESVGDETVQYDVDEAFAAEEGAPQPGSTDRSPREAGALAPDDATGPEADLEPGSELEPQPGPEKTHGEDVLEETPDFLQDTPDHDRLWFEQRPPRDFDFDD